MICRPDRRRTSFVLVLMVALGSLVVGSLTSCSSEPTERSAHHYKFVIPKGAMRLSSVGRGPEIFPANLEVHVGDTIEIVNEDDFDEVAGPYLIKAGTSVSQRFASPGTLTGSCRLGAGDFFTLTILE